MGLQAVEQPETIHTAKRVEDTCICSSLHVQGTFIYTDSHRCPLHNDTMEHNCTSKSIVPGLIVPGDGQLDTPQAAEDENLVNIRYYHCCPVHNDTLEHNCMTNNIVTGQTNFVQFGELPETINMAQPVGDTCICSMLHIQGKVVQKYYKRCPVHNNNEEHIY